MKSDGGYVYMVKLNFFKNCYKIGSCVDPYKRVANLEKLYGSLDVVICGSSEHKLKTEREIQRKLYSHSNRYHTYNCTSKQGDIIGPVESKEHFLLEDPYELLKATRLFSACCGLLMGRDFVILRTKRFDEPQIVKSVAMGDSS